MRITFSTVKRFDLTGCSVILQSQDRKPTYLITKPSVLQSKYSMEGWFWNCVCVCFVIQILHIYNYYYFLDFDHYSTLSFPVISGMHRRVETMCFNISV